MKEFTGRVAVIGAGICGIAALRQLSLRGVDVVAFERESEVGGLWVYHDEAGRTAAYKSLHIKGPREEFGFLDLPMDDRYNRFPSWSDIVSYLNRYVDEFDLRPMIRFDTEVTRVAQVGETWTVTTADGASEEFAAVIIASGHHERPWWPSPAYPGEFNGTQIHSHEYQSNKDYVGSRTLVVGAGNSAIDIVVDIAWVADQTFMSVRRGFQIFPQTLFGRPRMYALDVPLSRLPRHIRQWAMKHALRLITGKAEQYGLPTPEHGVFATRPTISDTVLERINHGHIVAKPGVARLDGDAVEFVDGSREVVDTIIWSTGYRIVHDYLDDARLGGDASSIPLYLHVFPPDIPHLFFVGLIQPLGTMPRLSTAQCEVIALHLTGTFTLPSPAEMRMAYEADTHARGRQLVDSHRNKTQIEVKPYYDQLDRALRAGAPKGQRRKKHVRARLISWS